MKTAWVYTVIVQDMSLDDSVGSNYKSESLSNSYKRRVSNHVYTESPSHSPDKKKRKLSITEEVNVQNIKRREKNYYLYLVYYYFFLFFKIIKNEKKNFKLWALEVFF